MYLQMESTKCLEECLWSPGLQTSPKVHFQSVNESIKRGMLTLVGKGH